MFMQRRQLLVPSHLLFSSCRSSSQHHSYSSRLRIVTGQSWLGGRNGGMGGGRERERERGRRLRHVPIVLLTAYYVWNAYCLFSFFCPTHTI